MMYYYQTEASLPSTEKAGMLPASRLISLLEQVSADHVDLLGIGRSFTAANGLFWAVVRQNLALRRLPAPGEYVQLSTWPGKVSHGLFPRWYRMTAADGSLLLHGIYLWVLMDLNSREMISPAARGLALPDFSRLRTEGPAGLSPEKQAAIAETEAMFPSVRPPKLLPENAVVDFTVPPEYIDRNGHMNNARYFDAVESFIRRPDDGLRLNALQMEFTHEARLGEEIQIALGREDSTAAAEHRLPETPSSPFSASLRAFSAEGRLREKLIFRMKLTYHC